MPRHRRSTPTTLPDGDIEVASGTVRLEREPGRPDSITLYLDGVPSSHVVLNDPGDLRFEYMQQMATAVDWAFSPGTPLKAIHLGGAACALPLAIDASRPGSRQLVAEVDAVLATLVRDWFDLPRAPRLRLRAIDGRALLSERHDSSAEVVLRDAFAPDRVPDHMRTREFFADVLRVIAPHGLYVGNCAGISRDAAASAELRGELAAMRETFDWLAIITDPGFWRGRRHANVVTLATPGPPPADAATLASLLRRLPFAARLVGPADVEKFIAGAGPLRDPTPAL